MHPDYDHFLYPINFQKVQIPAKNQYFSRINNQCVSQDLWKKTSIFLVWNLITTGYQIETFPLEKYFRTLKYGGWNNGVKLWEFGEYPGAFADKVTADIDFTNEVVVQCDVPDVKTLFYVLVIYKWSQINFGVNTYE